MKRREFGAVIQIFSQKKTEEKSFTQSLKHEEKGWYKEIQGSHCVKPLN